ncbi:MAG: class D sortase [Acidobacteriota bacterium]|nr:class D sortase [Acidobacteriota bacterium]
MQVTVKSKRAIAWIEGFLWLVGCSAIGYCAFIWGRAQFDQAQANWALEHVLPGDHGTDNVSAAPNGPAEGSLVGRIDIPRLDLSVIVFEGTSDDTLARGAGHLRGTAAPGESGNVALAAHRDTFFRGLRDIRPGDHISVKTPTGNYAYSVDSTAVVPPTQTEVLRPTEDATLTLITCYPFNYIGNAPERFIVRAHGLKSVEQSF